MLDDAALAARYAPILRFDEREPFLPVAVGYQVARAESDSPSFPRRFDRLYPGSPFARVIEYAIWWDWDIQHLYELEHVWVTGDAADQARLVEGSWHGGYLPLGPVAQRNGRPVVYSQPGKHALADSATRRRASTSRDAGTSVLRSAGVQPPVVPALGPGAAQRSRPRGPGADLLFTLGRLPPGGVPLSPAALGLMPGRGTCHSRPVAG